MIHVSRSEDGGILIEIKGDDQRELTLAAHPDKPHRLWAVRSWPGGNPQGSAVNECKDLLSLAMWLARYRYVPEREQVDGAGLTQVDPVPSGKGGGE